MSKAILKSLAVLGALAISGSAYASPVKLTYSSNNGVSSFSVQKTTPQTASYSGVIPGAFTMTETGTSDSFIAFCVDIYTSFSGSPTGMFEEGDPTAWSYPQTISQTVLDTVQALFDTGYSAAVAANAEQAAGFQLALWEVLYETDTSGLNLSNGTFQASANSSGNTSQSNALIAAADFLTGIAGYDGQKVYDLTFYASTDTNPKLQNIVSASLAPPAPVPVPAAGLLLLAGLAGLGVAARRRKEV